MRNPSGIKAGWRFAGCGDVIVPLDLCEVVGVGDVILTRRTTIMRTKSIGIGVSLLIGTGSMAAGDLKALIKGLQAKDSFEGQKAAVAPRRATPSPLWRTPRATAMPTSASRPGPR